MRYGDLDGKGTIYDDSGQMLFHSDECMTKTINGMCIGIYKRHKAGWKVIFMDGLGCFVITNLRTVFLRDPKSYPGGEDKVAKRLHSFSDGQYWPDKAEKIQAAGGKEFFEILHDEVTKIKHKGKESSILTEIEGIKHKIMVEKEIGEALEKILTEGGML
ncbi:MAG: hypothetical protein JSV09_09590 [Thermoplasmata archaeon]|nr:MAG: hypothetical protein JSV09_09590 [Thermoplasmata archaeon]